MKLCCYSAIFPIILREREGRTEVLLALRQNTGYMDGKWDFAGSGHVDEGETAVMAVVRECGEELGIRVNEGDVEFVHLSHRVGRGDALTYYDIYFLVKAHEGTPIVNEPEKCGGLGWFAIDSPPDDMIDYRKPVLTEYWGKVHYSEFFC